MPTAFPFTIDETVPDGSTESCRLLDDRIREVKANYNAVLGIAGQLTAPIGTISTIGVLSLIQNLVVFKNQASLFLQDQASGVEWLIQSNSAGLQIFLNTGTHGSPVFTLRYSLSTTGAAALATDLLTTSGIAIGDSTVGTTVFASNVQTNFYTFLIPANALGTTGQLLGELRMFVNSILNNSNLTIIISYAGFTVATLVLNNITGITQTNFGIIVRTSLSAANSTGQQWVSVSAFICTEVSALAWGVSIPTLWSLSRLALITHDSTNAGINQNFQVDVLWSLADSANSVTAAGMFLDWAAK